MMPAMTRRRWAWAILTLALPAVAWAGEACSSSSGPAGFGDDAGTDAYVAEEVAEGRREVAPPPVDAGPEINTSCAQVKGPCGIVAQDCPAGQECVLTQASQNTYSTTCQKTTASEILPRGSLCCPNGG